MTLPEIHGQPDLNGRVLYRTSSGGVTADSRQPVAQSCQTLLESLAVAPQRAKTLNFNVEGRDVYNITAPFDFDGLTLIGGRVEHRESEHAEIVLFRRETDENWIPHFTDRQLMGLQDPCITVHEGELFLGGVRFPIRGDCGRTTWRMDFYRGKTLATLRHFLSGPSGMKDIRFKVLPEGRVAVFSRPQGPIGGRGKIGFAIAPSLRELSTNLIATAPLLEGQFLEDEWGGANEVHLLKNGVLGVLGHIACMDERGHRHYYPMAFCMDVERSTATPVRVIATRAAFPKGPAKRDDLQDVVFSGGLVRLPQGEARLYAGLSDATAAYVQLADPFVECE